MKYADFDIKKLPYPIKIVHITDANHEDFEKVMKEMFEVRIPSKSFNILQSSYSSYMTPQNTIKWSCMMIIEITNNNTRNDSKVL
jgi:hypothetical protein